MSDNGNSELRQFVVFRLGDEEFGADIINVREIIRLPEITSVPSTPSLILGVVNLRGEMIPILSLHRLFGGDESTTDSDTRVVVVDANGRNVGLVVDSVSEVLRLRDDAISKPPESIGSSASYYIDGIARVDERLVLMVNMSHLVDTGVENEKEIIQNNAA